MTFCNLLILLMLTVCHDYTTRVRAADAVLQKLKDGKIRPVDLAKALAVNRSTASLMLSGKRGIPIWHLDAIASLLNVQVPELVTPRRTEMSSRTQSDRNKSIPMTSSVTDVGAEWPISAGSSLTGGTDASRASRRLSTPKTLRAELEIAKQIDQAAEIVRHASLIIQLARGTLRPGRETPTLRTHTSGHDPSDAPVRERRTGTHGAKTSKRSRS